MCNRTWDLGNKESVKFFFTGDIVLNDETYYGQRLVESELYSLIEGCDIVCGNLEGSIQNEELLPVPKRGPTINNGKQCPKRLKESGFNMLTLANNHIMDYGLDGMIYSLEMLGKDFCCIGAGTDISSVYRLQKVQAGGLKIGFICVAESQYGVCKESGGGFAWMLSRNLWQLFHQANRECDYYFVICHCGAEELEVPLPEVQELYRTYIDLGATAVIGHHPHVIQGCETYRGKKIFYSLGNFAFDMKEQGLPYNPIGLCVLVEMSKDNVEYRPIVTEYKDGNVTISRTLENFENVDKILHLDDEYRKQVDKYCIESYVNCFKKYYALVLGMDIENKENLIKFAQHRLNGDEILWDDLFLYHNIAIETNRWICERALNLMMNSRWREDSYE